MAKIAKGAVVEGGKLLRGRFPLFPVLVFLVGASLWGGCGNEEDEKKKLDPRISEFSPDKASHGTHLHIQGEGFSAAPSENRVTLNGVPAKVLSATSTELSVVVPKNLFSSGFLQVSVGEKTATSSTVFTYVPTVVFSTLAGDGTAGDQNGAGAQAQFYGPFSIAADAAGNLYVADTWNNRIRKLTPDGRGGVEVSTLAGDGIAGDRDDAGEKARFNQPHGIAIDSAGNLYVTDAGNNCMGNRCIRKLTPDGRVSTPTLTGMVEIFSYPIGIAIDAADNLYVADGRNHKIYKLIPDGEQSLKVSILAGSTAGDRDGMGEDAWFHRPSGIAADAVGNLYVADRNNHRIRKITSAGRTGVRVSTLAGDGIAGDRDGTGEEARFNEPNGIAIDSAGNLYVTDFGNRRIRKLTPDGRVSTLAGDGECGLGVEAQFCAPFGITTDAAGNLYMTDFKHHRILKAVFE